jgi:hypothetical protein
MRIYELYHRIGGRPGHPLDHVVKVKVFKENRARTGRGCRPTVGLKEQTSSIFRASGNNQISTCFFRSTLLDCYVHAFNIRYEQTRQFLRGESLVHLKRPKTKSSSLRLQTPSPPSDPFSNSRKLCTESSLAFHQIASV